MAGWGGGVSVGSTAGILPVSTDNHFRTVHRDKITV